MAQAGHLGRNPWRRQGGAAPLGVARVLHGIASDPTVCGALRWRAARALAGLGPAGRAQAIPALLSISTDDTLPATARANAARELAKTSPDCRHDALDILHTLTSSANPLHRVQIYLAMGTLDTTDATPALRTMADDRTLGPVARLRSAEALAQLRRDHREAASIVVRELMHDPTIPRHIRTIAACHLACWSALCRQEARDLLHTLNTDHPVASEA